MQERRSFYLLIAIMGVVALITMAVTNVILYQVAFNEKEQSLTESAQSQARLIEAMARYNRRSNRIDWETPVGERGPGSLLSERAAADTIAQLKDAHQHYLGFGETGEFVLAGIEGENIVFLLRHRDEINEKPDPLPLYSEYAEPMRRALLSESGVMVGQDYRGIEVLAAYEPVDVLNFGIVAKIDMSEIRAPFIKGAVYTFIISMIMILLGAILFRKITTPIIMRIRDSEHRYRSLVEEINEWVWAVDKEGVITYSSPYVESLLGYDDQQIMGHKLVDFVDKQSKERLPRGFLGHPTLNHAVTDVELVVKNSEGQKIFMELSAVPVYSTKDGFLGFRGVARDISVRKHSETELHQLRSYLANIIDSMPSIMIGVDKSGRVTQWNTEAARVTGVSNSDAIGQPLGQVFPRMEPEMLRVSDAVSTRHELIDAKRAYHLDGNVCYEDVTIYPLIANGVEGAVIRVDDVTEQVRLEELMIQSEKMLSVGGLAAGMAHEINNPLAGMMQTASVMINRLTLDELQANQQVAENVGTSMDKIHAFMDQRGILRMLAAINESGSRVAGIVDNMLSFARKSDANSTSHDINELLDKSIELSATDYDLKKKYDFKSIAIIKDYADDLPLIPCEGVKIQQVFLNLFRNGAEAMQEGNVTKPMFTLRSYFEQDMVCIVIEDNGPGMDEDTRKRLFEPFFTTKPVGEGTGLGLSVSYFIITENHGGEMTVESEPENGTRFYIRLPCEKSENQIGILEGTE